MLVWQAFYSLGGLSSPTAFLGVDSGGQTHLPMLIRQMLSHQSLSLCGVLWNIKALNFDGGKIIYFSLATYVCILAPFIKKAIPLSIDVTYWFYQKLIDHKYKGLFLDFKFYFTDPCIYPRDSATFPWMLQLLEIWMLRNIDSLSFLIFKIDLVILGTLHFHLDFRNILSILFKTILAGILTVIALNFCIIFGRKYCNFNKTKYFDPWTWNILS